MESKRQSCGIEDPEPLVLAVADAARWRQPVGEVGHELSDGGRNLVLVVVPQASERGDEILAADRDCGESLVLRRAVHAPEKLPDPLVPTAGRGVGILRDESVGTVMFEESGHVAHAVGVALSAGRAASPVDEGEPALEQHEAEAPAGGLNGE